MSDSSSLEGGKTGARPGRLPLQGLFKELMLLFRCSEFDPKPIVELFELVAAVMLFIGAGGLLYQGLYLGEPLPSLVVLFGYIIGSGVTYFAARVIRNV